MPYPEPATPKTYAHYLALKAASNYLKIDELEDGYIYIMHGRNSYLGVWRAELNGFTIVRTKLGVDRLDLEYHWDANGTAKPLVKLSGPVAADQRRQALDAAHALVTHEKFMELTASFTQ